MNLANIIATTGVTILLVAFFLNLNKKVEATSLYYILSNTFGAGLCCASSIMIKFYPFVVLEAIWSIVAIVSLFKNVPRGTFKGPQILTNFVMFHVEHMIYHV